MPFSEKVKVMVWGLQGGRCALWGCRKPLVLKVGESPDAYSVVGEAAHIVAEKPDGPRGASPLTLTERNSFSNAILMCSEHHKLIDDHPDKYSVEMLLEPKHEWESEFTRSTAFDAGEQSDRERYAEYLDEWITRSHLSEWSAWSSYILGGDWPRLGTDLNADLSELQGWLFNRVWPERYPALRKAFGNFRLVLQDFLNVFHRHSEKSGSQWETTKFYHGRERWLPDREYNEGLRRYDFHVDMVEDLVLELTRAANYVCEVVRAYLDPEFRISEGVLTVEAGPYMDLSWRVYRPEYKATEKAGELYPGLKGFKVIRHTRDIHMGRGVTPNDPEALEDLAARRNSVPDLDY